MALCRLRQAEKDQQFIEQVTKAAAQEDTELPKQMRQYRRGRRMRPPPPTRSYRGTIRQSVQPVRCVSSG
eukprot:1585539-Pleurochrysis_carterae.AAC.1